MSLLPKVQALLKTLREGLHERDEIAAVALLGLLAGQNTFLLGPPGTAKSLLSRRLAAVFSDAAYFECLMNRFTTPEELFGAVSIKALKEDRYCRQTQGHLPAADVAFLDEIWKSSPALLNTLLSILNEKIFKNGAEIQPVPLKGLLAASNETPPPGQGLEALYDRFLLRLLVPPTQDMKHFMAFVQAPPAGPEIKLDPAFKISAREWLDWQATIHQVKLSTETLNVIRAVRLALADEGEKLGVYVSDRRWQRAIFLVKASAFFSDRPITHLADALILRHCLWSSLEHRKPLMKIVEQAVQESGLCPANSLAALDEEKERLDQEIQRELFHSADVYKTVLHGDSEFFECELDKVKEDYGYHDTSMRIFIPVDKVKSAEEFNPVDANGNAIRDFLCCFDRQGSCAIRIDTHRSAYRSNSWKYSPELHFHKGDRKSDVNTRLVASLARAVSDLKNRLMGEYKHIGQRRATYLAALVTPFVPDKLVQGAVLGVGRQMEDFELRIKDCERLEQLCA